MNFRPLTRILPIALPLLLAVPAMLLASPDAGAGIAGGGAMAVLGFGFLLGLKHALDADHLVAVSAIVGERRDIMGAAIVGGVWGLGHTAALLVAGLIIVLLRPELPETLAPILELLVAVMIVGLGIGLLVKIARHGGATLHNDIHAHGALMHKHPHLHYGDGHGEQGGQHHALRFSRKPFVVGLIHGLAGSATLVLLVLAEIPDPGLGLLYILIFGLGSVGGMLAMSTLFALPYAALARRFVRAELGLRVSAGLLSIAFGAYMIYEIGFVDGLF